MPNLVFLAMIEAEICMFIPRNKQNTKRQTDMVPVLMLIRIDEYYVYILYRLEDVSLQTSTQS